MGAYESVEFGTVIIVVSIVAACVAMLSYLGTAKLYDDIGKGDLVFDEPGEPGAPDPGGHVARAEAAAELRQLVEAKSYRRVQRGEEPLDVDAEIASLTAPLAPPSRDEALRDEVRQHVIASNARRQRRGEEPLDVEPEVDRQLRDLGG